MGLMGSREKRLETALLASIERREEMLVEEILKQHPECVNMSLCGGSTNPICRATFLGYKNIVILLVKHGANVNLCS